MLVACATTMKPAQKLLGATWTCDAKTESPADGPAPAFNSYVVLPFTEPTMSSMRLTPMKTGGVTTETAPEIAQLVETNSMTTGFGVARKAVHAKGFCVLSGALARHVIVLLKGVSGAAGSAQARTVSPTQRGAASAAVRTTWRNDAAGMQPSLMAI